MHKAPKNKSQRVKVGEAGTLYQNRFRVAEKNLFWIPFKQMFWELPMILTARSTKLELKTFSLAVIRIQNFIERFHGPSFLVSKKGIKFSVGGYGQIPLYSCCKNLSLQCTG